MDALQMTPCWKMLPKCASSTLTVILRHFSSLLWPSLQPEEVCSIYTTICITNRLLHHAVCFYDLLTVLPMFIIIYCLWQPFNSGCHCIITFKLKKKCEIVGIYFCFNKFNVIYLWLYLVMFFFFFSSLESYVECWLW